MKQILSYSILLLFISSCISKKKCAELEAKNKELQFTIEELEHPIENKIVESLDMLIFEEFLDAKDQQFESFLSGNIVFDEAFNVEKAEAYEFLNGKLPKTFYERAFFKGLSATTYDLFNLPGKIVKKTGQSSYNIVTPVQLIKTGTVLENDYIEEGLIFKDYLTKGMTANGSYIIGSFEAKTDQVVEITLTDILKSFPKPAHYDTERLKKYQEQIKDMEDSDTYFFVQSATLTIGSGRTFNSSKFNKDINSIYFTAKGKVYKTNELIKNERIITVELISLKDMLL